MPKWQVGHSGGETVSERSISKKTRCLEDVRRNILTQVFEPGSYLDEADLAESYEISRPPLREVLYQLAGEGYVILHKNRGAQVAPMTHKTMRNFFMVAPMIYAAVTRLAAEHATEAQLMRLKDTQTLFRKAIRDGDTGERALLNQRFHAVIGEMADNEFLTPSLRCLLVDHTRIGMSFYNPRNRSMAEQRNVAADQHDQFIALIEKGDVDAAGQLAIDHWALSRAEMESFVTPVGMQIPLGPVPGEKRWKGTS